MNLLFEHGPDGQPIHGSKEALLAYIRRGGLPSVGLESEDGKTFTLVPAAVCFINSGEAFIQGAWLVSDFVREGTPTAVLGFRTPLETCMMSFGTTGAVRRRHQLDNNVIEEHENGIPLKWFSTT